MSFAKKIYFFWGLLVVFFFNHYAYEISKINANIRVFVKTGEFSVRKFTEEGLPVSYSPKMGRYQSPFYVVHYAILYSEGLGDESNGYHWREDPSLKYWDVAPDAKSIEENTLSFKNSVDWLVDNVKNDKYGNVHFFYNFDWKYNGYPNGELKAPWWSGLTDAYAIIPLLRAYDLFGDIKYLNTAEKLYQSSTTTFEKGGSLTALRNKDVWIEEYADSRVVNPSDLAFVFNGMVYSTYGIKSYEEYLGDRHYSDALFKSILNNANKFDVNGWSNYDLLSTPNNIKYHTIHSFLLNDLIGQAKSINSFGDFDFNQASLLAESWMSSSKNFAGIYYLIYGPKSISYFHFLFTLLFFLLFPYFFVKVLSSCGLLKNER